MAVNFVFRLFPFVSFPQTSEDFMTWGSPRARVYVKCVGTVRAASHPPVWIHRKCELRRVVVTEPVLGQGLNPLDLMNGYLNFAVVKWPLELLIG